MPPPASSPHRHLNTHRQKIASYLCLSWKKKSSLEDSLSVTKKKRVSFAVTLPPGYLNSKSKTEQKGGLLFGERPLKSSLDSDFLKGWTNLALHHFKS